MDKDHMIKKIEAELIKSNTMAPSSTPKLIGGNSVEYPVAIPTSHQPVVAMTAPPAERPAVLPPPPVRRSPRTEIQKKNGSKPPLVYTPLLAIETRGKLEKIVERGKMLKDRLDDIILPQGGKPALVSAAHPDHAFLEGTYDAISMLINAMTQLYAPDTYRSDVKALETIQHGLNLLAQRAEGKVRDENFKSLHEDIVTYRRDLNKVVNQDTLTKIKEDALAQTRNSGGKSGKSL